jgi:hypothetical protein
LQKLASKSHRRQGERRIFTATKAQQWVGSNGWADIEKAMRAGRLPIIAAMGRNDKDVNEYRFGHMSYQEYLTGREYYQELTAAQFSTTALVKLFGRQPLDAFTDVKQHLVLQLLAGILSPEQRTIFLAVMCGGRVEVPALVQKPSRKSATRCEVIGCPEAHHNVDGYCHNHREAAASALENATVHGGDTLRIKTKKLGRAEMEALAPYLRDSTHLRTLELSGAKLGKDGMEMLVQALETNTTVTMLDLWNDDLAPAGAKVVAKLLARCVRGCWVLFSFSVPLVLIFSAFPTPHLSLHRRIHARATNALNTATPTASHSWQHPRKCLRHPTTALAIHQHRRRHHRRHRHRLRRHRHRLRHRRHRRHRRDIDYDIDYEISDNGALLVLDISNNSIGRQSRDGNGRAPWIATPEGPQAIAEALKSNVRDIMYMHIISANICHDKRALSKLVMCQNDIHGAEAGRAFADMLAQNTVLKELDLSAQKFGRRGEAMDAAFAKEFAVGISGNGALTSLNLSSNNINAEGAKIVAEAIKVTYYAMAVSLVPMSCPSDHWLNCCCSLLSPG